MAAVATRLPTGELPPATKNEEAALLEVEAAAVGEVVELRLELGVVELELESPTRAARAGTVLKSAVMEPLVHDEPGVVLAPETKLTAAHWVGRDKVSIFKENRRKIPPKKEEGTHLVEKAIRRVASNPNKALLPHPLLRRLHSRLAQVATVVLGEDGVQLGPVAGGLGVEGGAEKVVALGVAKLDDDGVAVDVEVGGRVLGEVGRAAAARRVALKPLIHIVALERGRLQEREVGIGGREEEQPGGEEGADRGHGGGVGLVGVRGCEFGEVKAALGSCVTSTRRERRRRAWEGDREGKMGSGTTRLRPRWWGRWV